MDSVTGPVPSIADTAWASLDGEIDLRSIDYYSAEVESMKSSGADCTARASKWISRLREFEIFWASNGRHPRENTRDRSVIPYPERRLGEWARYQRRFERELCDYQRARLDLSPAFEWDPLEAAWERNLYACRNYVMKFGRLPILTTADRDEFRAARWLGRQLEARRRARLTDERTLAIDQLLRSATISRPHHGEGTFRSR